MLAQTRAMRWVPGDHGRGAFSRTASRRSAGPGTHRAVARGQRPTDGREDRCSRSDRKDMTR